MKILLTSDTHGILNSPPRGEWDLFFHCGDVCPNWNWQASDEWLYQSNWIRDRLTAWLNLINAENKFIIFGNHDMVPSYEIQKCLGDSAIFAHDKSFTINDEVIYANGSSWNAFQLRNWGFGYSQKNIHPYIDKIPDNTTILITHEPALGSLDWCRDGNIGSPALSNKRVELKNLKLHAFGHVHESVGYRYYDNGPTVINAARGWFEFDTITKEVRKLI